jgi:lipopolysaccharide export system permease protein
MTVAAAFPGVMKTLRPRLLQIERYVLLRTLRAVAGALAVIASIVLLIDYVEVARSVGTRADISFLAMLGLTLMKSPSTILLLLPFVFLFGTLAAFVSLNRRSELVAMRAAGVSAWRFIFPAAAAAFLIGALTVFALNPLASSLLGAFENTRDSLMESRGQATSSDVWLRQGDGRSQVVIHARSKADAGVRLMNVSFFIYTIDDQGDLVFSRRIEAREATLRQGAWQLRGAREATPGRRAETYDLLSIPSTIDPSDAFTALASPQSIAFWSLPGVIAQIESAGFSASAYRLRLHQLLATPLLFAAMSILAAGFSLRLMRLGGLAALAGSGVALGFLFFFFNEFCSALGKAEILPSAIAAWTPPILALLSGFTLLFYTEDG